MTSASTSLPRRQTIAVVGSGIAGMSAAWLLSQRHDVTLYEKASRPGGHTNTVIVHTSLGPTPVDTGFIVYNEAAYPNLTALFAYLGVKTKPSDMSFGVSLRGGQIEYSSVGASAFLRGGRNLISPRFWSMTRDLLRFYGQAPLDLLRNRDEAMSLGEYLRRGGYGEAFQNDHILPQAAAIWSAPLEEIRKYPAYAFVRFFENHGLLRLHGRPQWRTVDGGSRAYVEKLTAAYADRIRLGSGVVSVRREGASVWVRDICGQAKRYDSVVIATHADESLAILEDASAKESALLGVFRYARNRAVLHTDRTLMPRSEAQWASWNYVGGNSDHGCVVTYWMNKLQGIKSKEPLLLTLNPHSSPRRETVLYETEYEHPVFDATALYAQRRLWALQGARNTWFCGAYFGAGFHEDGLQAGLAVAEQLGAVRRPWNVKGESDRIHLSTPAIALAA